MCMYVHTCNGVAEFIRLGGRSLSRKILNDPKAPVSRSKAGV